MNENNEKILQVNNLKVYYYTRHLKHKDTLLPLNTFYLYPS